MNTIDLNNSPVARPHQTNARQNLRLSYASPLHFAKQLEDDPQKQGDDLFYGIMQDLSAYGLQILSANSLIKGQKLSLYLNLTPYGIIPVDAVVQWTKIETSLNPINSPYWLRCGLRVEYNRSQTSKKTVLSYLKERFMQEHTKVTSN